MRNLTITALFLIAAVLLSPVTLADKLANLAWRMMTPAERREVADALKKECTS